MGLFNKSNDDNENFTKRVQDVIEIMNDDQDEALRLVNGIIDDLGRFTPDEIRQRNLSWEALNAYNLKGSILNARDELDGAEICFDTVINGFDDMDSCAWMNKGIISKKRKNYELALECYDKALIEAPEGIADVVAGAKNEVMSMMRADLKDADLDEFSAKAKELIENGIDSKENQDYWSAFDCFEQARDEDPSCATVAEAMIEDTKEELTKVFYIGPVDDGDDEKSQLKRAAVYYVFSEYNPFHAYALNERALNNFDENDAFALNTRGIIYFYLDEYEKAIEAFDRCVEVDEDYLYAYLNKAIVLKRMKRTEEASEAIHEIMKMPGKYENPSEDLLRLYRLTVVFNSMFYLDLL
jgi:tetratricopeptide (TPR) repeat protein